MSIKTVVIGIIILVIIGIGAYVLITRSSARQAPAAQQAAATPGDQVQAQDVSVGAGTQATPGSVVSVLYVAKLRDGTVFDSSAMHNNQPLTFQLGAQGLIPGFQIGVNGMKEGGERLIAVPPSLGYAGQDVKDKDGKVIIPANSDLIFDIKLVKVQPAPAASANEPAAPSAPAKKR